MPIAGVDQVARVSFNSSGLVASTATLDLNASRSVAVNFISISCNYFPAVIYARDGTRVDSMMRWVGLNFLDTTWKMWTLIWSYGAN